MKLYKFRITISLTFIFRYSDVNYVMKEHNKKLRKIIVVLTS